MNKQAVIILIVYILIINIVASLTAIADKKRAERGKWRIPESTLMLLGLFGGATLEFITMKKIRHKTKHIKFMVGLPVEMFLHYVLIILLIYKVASI
ncbi:MAG: DUF1294 domain-containing protein [Eubacterium sp.]|nr:DUF1294 domain-containing protein [Eubacterium sp.]